MNRVRRKNRGFAPAGALPPEQIGLSAKRSRELRLGLAWRRVAGEAVTRRACVRAVVRGTLIVDLLDADRSWAETIIELLPRLAGRLALSHPDLGVRRCRLVFPDGRRLDLELARPSHPVP
jgi:hypothetical protein